MWCDHVRCFLGLFFDRKGPVPGPLGLQGLLSNWAIWNGAVPVRLFPQGGRNLAHRKLEVQRVNHQIVATCSLRVKVHWLASPDFWTWRYAIAHAMAGKCPFQSVSPQKGHFFCITWAARIRELFGPLVEDFDLQMGIANAAWECPQVCVGIWASQPYGQDCFVNLQAGVAILKHIVTKLH